MRIYSIVIFLLAQLLFANKQQVESEEILLKNGIIELPGTLTRPKNANKLIIWIHGSGNVDRNGNQAGLNIGANYIQQFREEINKMGIAFFSFDKRTVSPKNIPHLKGILFDDLVSDAKTVISHFKKDKSFSEITIIGHSQGSLVAMLASENAQKYISLAGPGEEIDKTIIKQISAQSSDLGDIAKSHIEELKKTGQIKDINPLLISLFAKQNHNFLSNWFQYNPAVEISKINIPTLIINGDKDLQVKPEDAVKLKAAKPDAEMKIIDNMNHVLKEVKNLMENQSSYTSANFPISKELITAISEFVKK